MFTMNFVLLSLASALLFSKTVSSMATTELEEFYNVKYKVYLKGDPEEEVDFRRADFKGKTVQFLVQDYKSGDLLTVKYAIFKYSPDVDVIVLVDWSDYGSAFSGDSNSVERTACPTMGEDVFNKMAYVAKKGSTKIYVYALGYGAHIAGIAGRTLKIQASTQVDRIMAGDPKGGYFEIHPEDSLKCTDAKNVTVIHTNAGKLGWKDEMCGNDLWSYGGKLQPECELKPKFLRDKCSHLASNTRYIELLKGYQQKNKTKDVFVLCLDVSDSMSIENRGKRSQEAVKKVINELAEKKYIGLVSFNDTAVTRHKIIQIQNTDDRKSLLKALPVPIAAATSITRGLQLSMDEIREVLGDEELCSTIVLLSDGEHNRGPNPDTLVKDLTSRCIRVDSIAMGPNASQYLEPLAEETDGTVDNIPENVKSRSISDTYQTFLGAFNSKLPLEQQYVTLPTMTIGKDQGSKSRQKRAAESSNTVKYIIDKDIGLNTYFSIIAEDVSALAVAVKSDTGVLYGSGSKGVYTLDKDAQEIQFFIKDAPPGQWSVNVQGSKTTLTVVSARTYQRSTSNDAIRIDTKVSTRTLMYPTPIIVYVNIGYGLFPVIGAEVSLELEGYAGDKLTESLHDNGTYPDEMANDGIYSGIVRKLPKEGRYSGVISVTSDFDTRFVQSPFDPLEDMTDICNKVPCPVTFDFQREARLGAIKMADSKKISKETPGLILDLKVLSLVENEHLALLQWSVPKNSQIKSFVIRSNLKNTGTESNYVYKKEDVVLGDFGTGQISSSGKKRVLLIIPHEIWQVGRSRLLDKLNRFELVFAVACIFEDGKSGPYSNFAIAKVVKATQRMGLADVGHCPVPNSVGL